MFETYSSYDLLSKLRNQISGMHDIRMMMSCMQTNYSENKTGDLHDEEPHFRNFPNAAIAEHPHEKRQKRAYGIISMKGIPFRQDRFGQSVV